MLHPSTVEALHLQLCLHARPVLNATVFADCTHKSNIAQLTKFLNPLLALLPTLTTDDASVHDSTPPLHASPGLHVFLVKAQNAKSSDFDRARARLFLRMSQLDHVALALTHPVQCLVESVFTQQKAIQGDMKLVIEDFRPLAHHVDAIRNMAMKKGKLKLAQTLRIATGKTAQAIVVTEGAWMNIHSSNIEMKTKNIRQIHTHGIKLIEVKLGQCDKWDRLVLRELLFRGVGLALLVFRFNTLEALGKHIGRSKEITDGFKPIAEEQGRVLYLDCSATNNKHPHETTIQDVVDVVVERRMPRPSHKDVLLEASLGATGTAELIKERVQMVKSITHEGITGAGRKHVERIVHVLNGEISGEEARRASQRLMNRIKGLRSTVSTNVRILKNEREVIIKRGDMTGYSPAGSRGRTLIPESEYKGFTAEGRVPFTCDVRIKLEAGNVDEILSLRLLERKWNVVEKLAEDVQKGDLLFSVVDEKTTLWKGGNENYVIATRVDIEGGRMEEYMRGELVRHGIKALASGEAADRVGCCVLDLVPSLRGMNHVGVSPH